LRVSVRSERADEAGVGFLLGVGALSASRGPGPHSAFVAKGSGPYLRSWFPMPEQQTNGTPGKKLSAPSVKLCLGRKALLAS
jgi:hypothetical protein